MDCYQFNRWVPGFQYNSVRPEVLIVGKGACIGLNASFLNIIAEWLSDIKLGHCTTAFYLNENFCCWGSDAGERAHM